MRAELVESLDTAHLLKRFGKLYPISTAEAAFISGLSRHALTARHRANPLREPIRFKRDPMGNEKAWNYYFLGAVLAARDEELKWQLACQQRGRQPSALERKNRQVAKDRRAEARRIQAAAQAWGLPKRSFAEWLAEGDASSAWPIVRLRSGRVENWFGAVGTLRHGDAIAWMSLTDYLDQLLAFASTQAPAKVG
jgi:hypothetical protein